MEEAMNSQRMGMTGMFVAIISFSAAGCSTAPPDNKAVEVRAPEAASLKHANGNGVTVQAVNFDGYRKVVASHHGQVVVVDLWATWCIPCVQNFPHLVELHKKYFGRGVACVSLCLDNLGTEETAVETMLPAVRQFLSEQQASFDNLIATEPFDELAAVDKLGVAQIPTVFVFNK